MENKTIAVIKDIDIGMRDFDVPVLWFTACIPDGLSSLQILYWDKAYDLIIESGVRSVFDLNGKLCWLDTRKDGYATFIKYAKV